jgi:hypothetical protein
MRNYNISREKIDEMTRRRAWSEFITAGGVMTPAVDYELRQLQPSDRREVEVKMYKWLKVDEEVEV